MMIRVGPDLGALEAVGTCVFLTAYVGVNCNDAYSGAG